MSEGLVAVISTIATPLGLLLVACVNYLSQRAARRDAVRAQAAADHAASAVATASWQATAAAKKTNMALDDISATTHLVHTIVNSQHSKLVQLVAHLTARIAGDNPDDLQAQDDAREAAESVGEHLSGLQVKDIDLTKP